MVGSDEQPAPSVDFCQYDSGPGFWVDCYAELVVSSQAVSKTIAVAHCTYLQRDARLSGPEWPGKYRDGYD